MTTKIYEYRSGHQFEKMIGQFTRAFSGFQVQDGVLRGNETEKKTYRVPVVYGAMDRVTAAMINKRGFFKSNRQVPVISVVNTSIALNPLRKQDSNRIEHVKTNTSDSVKRLIGVPIVMGMDVNLICSSRTELYELLEQIMLCFNPRMEVTIRDSLTSANTRTEINLTGVQPDISYPLGESKDVVQMTLNFEFSTKLEYPHGVVDVLVNTVQATISDNSGTLGVQDVDGGA